MTSVFVDLLRAVITNIMPVLLLSTLAIPKYKRKIIYITVTIIIILVNVSVDYLFYRTGNYTAVFYVDLIMLIVIGAGLKPLFTDTLMQWVFSFVTMLNIYITLVFLSFMLRGVLPNPRYGVILTRVILFSVIYIVLQTRVSRFYRKMVNYWHIYILPVVSLLVCFLAYFFGGSIEDRLDRNYVPLLLLILLGLSIYVSIIHSLRTITKQYAIREENQIMQAERELLELSASNMVQRLELMEEVSAQNSLAAHDRRHFNNMLLELIENGKTNEAVSLLRNDDPVIPKINRSYCENPVVNTTVNRYANLVEQAGIPLKIALDIPGDLSVNVLELSMVISNLLENAVKACEKLPQNKVPYIRFICQRVGRLMLEMENPCDDDVTLDENGYPVSADEGHSIGSKIALAFAKKYDGELLYKIENGVFQVRLLV